MTTPTTFQLERACEACEGVSWYGSYNGRWYFKGYAVVSDDAASLTELYVLLDRQGFDMPMPDHQDSMGFNTLFAWSEDVFFPPRSKTNYQFRSLSGEAGS